MNNQNNTFSTSKLFDNIKKDKANFFIIILLFALPFFILRTLFYDTEINYFLYFSHIYDTAIFFGYTLLFSLLTSHFILNKGNKKPLMSDIVSFTVFNFKKIIIPSALISLILVVVSKPFPYMGIFLIIPLSFIPIFSLIKGNEVIKAFNQKSPLPKNNRMYPLLPTYIFAAMIIFAFGWFLSSMSFIFIRFISPMSISFTIIGILRNIISLLVVGFIFSLAMNLYYSSLSKKEKYDNEELNTLIKGRKKIQRKEKRDKTSPGRDRFNEDKDNRFKDENYNRFDDSDDKISF